jgi:ATP-binding cassette, subfamily F, member 3
MAILTLTNVRHSYGTRIVLDGATISVEPGEKIGLVGRNGSGKSTLMRVMEGSITPDGGTVAVQRSARVGYMSQDPRFDPEDSLRDAAEAAFDDLHRAHLELHRVFDQMATAEGDALERLLKKQVDLEARIELLGGYAIDHKIDATLHGLGFTDDQFTQKVTSLSGGQKGRLGLARLLLEEPDLLLLDEPTNHLDIEGRRWLEDFLADEFPGAVIIVSHDRWLLDRVVGRIVEVERGMIREYPGNYHQYVDLRRERMLTESRVYEKQLDKVRAEEQYIARYKAGQRAKQARGRATRLERFKDREMVERPIELDVMSLRLPKAPRIGDVAIAAEHLSKSYGDKELFSDLSISIGPGDRIGVIGPNGAGKTTLVRCLLGEIPADTGTVRKSPRLSVGYYRQLHEDLDLSLTIWEYLQRVIVGLDNNAKASEQQARDLAGAFLFSGDDQDKQLGVVSGGERSRAVLAGLVASAKNLLVLDEPTNHLDIPSAERLEATLAADPEEGGYDGAMLLISHDRALLEATCDRLIILDGEGNARVFTGTYSQWIERRQAEEKEAAAASKPKPVAKPQPVAAAAPKKRGPLERITLEQLEQKIEVIQIRIAAIDRDMVDPAVYSSGSRSRALQDERVKLIAELEPLEFEWARRAAEES